MIKKMQKKQLKLSAVLLLGFLGLTGLQAQVEMNLKENSGNQTTYALSEIRNITFLSGNIIVSKKAGNSDNYTLANVRYLNFNNIANGVQEILSTQTKAILFPNPVNDVLNLQLSSIVSKGVIQIISLDGKIVYNQTITGKKIVFQINVSNLTKGLYVCKINDGTNIGVIRFNKQ